MNRPANTQVSNTCFCSEIILPGQASEAHLWDPMPNGASKIPDLLAKALSSLGEAFQTAQTDGMTHKIRAEILTWEFHLQKGQLKDHLTHNRDLNPQLKRLISSTKHLSTIDNVGTLSQEVARIKRISEELIAETETERQVDRDLDSIRLLRRTRAVGATISHEVAGLSGKDVHKTLSTAYPEQLAGTSYQIGSHWVTLEFDERVEIARCWGVSRKYCGLYTHWVAYRDNFQRFLDLRELHGSDKPRVNNRLAKAELRDFQWGIGDPEANRLGMQPQTAGYMIEEAAGLTGE